MGNPFRYGCVVSGEYYCRRPELSSELLRYAESGQNVVIQGERRLGKTSLIYETFQKCSGMKLLYVDLMGTKSIADFCRKVTAAVVKLDQRKSFLLKTLDFLMKLRPTMSLDPNSGSASISLDARESDAISSIEEIMEMIAKHAKNTRLCVVFDEFQDMLNIADSDAVMSALRGKIQFQADVPYFFLGSVRNKMRSIFTDSRSPFFKSAILYDIPKLSDEDFASFLQKRFKAGKRHVPGEIVNRILEIAHRVPGDVQELCDAIWASTEEKSKVVPEDIEKALQVVFAREGKSFASLISLLTAIQMRVLREIALRGGKGVCGKTFLEQVNVPNASSVRKALLRLIDLDILFLDQEEYRFTNPFFGQWLKTIG